MRTLAAVLLFVLSAAAQAQEPSPLNDYRLFNTTEVFHLDPGVARLEVQGQEGQPLAPPSMSLRTEVGVTDHIQVGVAQVLTSEPGGIIGLAAVPVSVRYSLNSEANTLPGNPAIEASLIPRVNEPARASLRLLLAKDFLPRLTIAANAYLEQNLNRGTSEGVDGIYGLTSGVSYSLIPGLLHAGAEAQLGSAQYGQPRYYLVMALGPNVVPHRGPFALTASLMADLVRSQVRGEPMLTGGVSF